MAKIHLPGVEYSHRCDTTVTEKLNTRHCHDSYEILFVVDGKGRYLVEGVEFILAPRTLMFIRPFQYHCVELDPASTYDRYVINFSPNAVVGEVSDVLAHLFDEASGESGNFYSSDSLPQTIVSIFDKFEQIDRMPETERGLFGRLLLSELVLTLSAAGTQKISHSDGELGARIINYINEYIDSNISLDNLAKRFFVSKYYLCRSFKKYSGVSIHAYVNHKRVMYAKQLIDSGETASGAAYKVGFGDYSAFYRAYVKIVGKTPTSK